MLLRLQTMHIHTRPMQRNERLYNVTPVEKIDKNERDVAGYNNLNRVSMQMVVAGINMQENMKGERWRTGRAGRARWSSTSKSWTEQHNTVRTGKEMHERT